MCEKEKVILLRGDEPVKRYFCVRDRSKETVRMVLDNIEVYDFDTEEEAEAFRLGLCAIGDAKVPDFCEVTVQGYKSLLTLRREFGL
ncbi:MAG: hypothetical protein LBQ51_02290 [Desulfovibrio sp.]|jgi:hypothetical protein|nr:hypothetical protein [Desulfovibrio sp.]